MRPRSAWPRSIHAKSRIVELRFFAGLNVEEAAEVMGVSPKTIKREWRSAKAWLHREMDTVKSK
jgi:DNA-directed RNA polymerase specialized sigma24 family protein